jgi:hypothetical protein
VPELDQEHFFRGSGGTSSRVPQESMPAVVIQPVQPAGPLRQTPNGLFSGPPVGGVNALVVDGPACRRGRSMTKGARSVLAPRHILEKGAAAAQDPDCYRRPAPDEDLGGKAELSGSRAGRGR